jgi:hypothetical protein
VVSNTAYKVDKTTGAIVWKLSGTQRPESLGLARRSPQLHQRATRRPAAPRWARSASTTTGPTARPKSSAPRCALCHRHRAKTATLVEAVRDSSIPSSGCCGSARKLPGGNWVAGWGGTSQITENGPDGTQVFRLTGTFVYRGIPLLPGQFAASEFRAGMDARSAG